MIRIEEVSASSSTFDLIKEIRNQVFVIEQEVDPAEEFDEFEEQCMHLIAWVAGTAVGTCRIRKTEKGTKLERFAVLKAFRSKGVGYALLESCLKRTQGASLVYLHAQLTAMGLYEKGGFVKFGPLFYECNIAHYAMKLDSTS